MRVDERVVHGATGTLVGSAVAVGCWMVGRSMESDAMHVVGVQLLGLACLMTMFSRPRRAMCTS